MAQKIYKDGTDQYIMTRLGGIDHTMYGEGKSTGLRDSLVPSRLTWQRIRRYGDIRMLVSRRCNFSRKSMIKQVISAGGG